MLFIKLKNNFKKLKNLFRYYRAIIGSLSYFSREGSQRNRKSSEKHEITDEANNKRPDEFQFTANIDKKLQKANIDGDQNNNRT